MNQRLSASQGTGLMATAIRKSREGSRQALRLTNVEFLARFDFQNRTRGKSSTNRIPSRATMNSLVYCESAPVLVDCDDGREHSVACPQYLMFTFGILTKIEKIILPDDGLRRSFWAAMVCRTSMSILVENKMPAGLPPKIRLVKAKTSK